MYAGGFSGQRGGIRFVRRFGRELVEVFFPKEKIESLRFLQSSPKRDLLFWIVFVVPGTPKDLLCYFAGLTDLSWGKWLADLFRWGVSLHHYLHRGRETLWVEKTTFLPFWCLPERWQSAP